VYREVVKGRNTLYVHDVQSGERRVLIEGAEHYNFPQWSPAADVIAFTSNKDGAYEIYTIAVDGTNLTRLTQSPGNNAHSAWSPDGRWIAFSSGRGGFKDEGIMYKANPQSYGEVYVMRADGSDQHPLTDDQFEEATPGWLPVSSRK
jgi:Tol biopolymer transport system component